MDFDLAITAPERPLASPARLRAALAARRLDPVSRAGLSAAALLALLVGLALVADLVGHGGVAGAAAIRPAPAAATAHSPAPPHPASVAEYEAARAAAAARAR
ncbi:MAG TPA: hypothetical protein VMW35_00515 [Myxococcota bacterium]|jgi:hypothetical protein|nr:hypothetical protein [Myxococcota bacterium]